MNWLNIATIIIGALLTVAPQIIGTLPAGSREAATAILAAVVAIYHLYQPNPSAK
jgi:hypothetical protein